MLCAGFTFLMARTISLCDHINIAQNAAQGAKSEEKKNLLPGIWCSTGKDTLVFNVGLDERCDVQAGRVLDVDEPF
jgi:hypothetical protein